MTAREHDRNTSIIDKIDLLDLTFLMPLRIDSTERKENADTVIRYIFKHFNTSFIVLEADKEQKYFSKFNLNGLQYQFVEDSNEVYRKTKWINHLIAMADTPYVAVWDADAIAPPDQIIDSLERIRNGEFVMSLPFDGCFLATDKVSYPLFKKYLDIEILKQRSTVMNLLYSYRAVGGGYMVNKEKYIEAGGENEKFIGWGPEDSEHVKRMEVLNLAVHFSKGPLFHLWHPRGKNSRYANLEIEIHNRKMLLDTCKIYHQNKSE